MPVSQVAAEQLIAGTGADPSLVPLAASYMRIRALAQPAVLITMASQGGLLAQRVSEGCSPPTRQLFFSLEQ
jgi:Na+-driven multidrug efflux pump